MSDNLRRLREMSEDATELVELTDQADGDPSPNTPTSIYAMGDVATKQWKTKAVEAFADLRRVKKEDGYSHTQKMIDTIVALVDAKLAGNGRDSVFDRPDTCSRATYYRTWKSDPDFAACYERVMEIAQHWQDNRATNALAEAHERLVLATPAVVNVLLRSIMEANKERDWTSVQRGGFGILDRADKTTAVKQDSGAEQLMQKLLGDLDLTKLSDDQLERVLSGENPLKVILDDYLGS